MIPGSAIHFAMFHCDCLSTCAVPLSLPFNLLRRQGMRMGNTFSRALDPSKPLLFGDFTLGILQEEVWHPTAARLSWQNPLSGATSGLTSDLPPGQPSASRKANSKGNLGDQCSTDQQPPHEPGTLWAYTCVLHTLHAGFLVTQ